MNGAPLYFYADAIRGRRIALLAGPFATLDEAKAYVEPCRKRLCELDAFAHFYLFGVTSFVMVKGSGKFNSYLGIDKPY